MWEWKVLWNNILHSQVKGIVVRMHEVDKERKREKQVVENRIPYLSMGSFSGSIYYYYYYYYIVWQDKTE